MSSLKRVPVFEEIIECDNCGHTMNVRYDWNFDHKCEVCGKEGCSNCMMAFKRNNDYFYHITCSDVLPTNEKIYGKMCINRPYHGKKHILCKDDIIMGDKYKFHHEDGESEIIIAIWWEHVQFYGNLFHYQTLNGVEKYAWPWEIGLTSEAANFEYWGKDWLEKVK